MLPPMKARQESAVRSFKVMMGGTVIVPLAILFFAAWQHYHAISKLADERIASSLDIAAEQAKKVFQSVDVLFSSVSELTAGRTDQELRLDEATLGSQLKGMVAAIPDVRSIWMFDLTGRPIATSRIYPVPNLDNSDRDYFIAQRNKNVGIYVGKVLRPRVGDQIFFSVSRKRYDSKGNITGITAVVISPTVFENFYERLARNTSASYAMIRSDGAVLARYPLAAQPDIVLPETSGFRRTVLQNPNGGKYTAISGVDGLRRRFDIRRLGDLPVYATSSLEVSSINAEWREWVLVQLAFGVPVTLLLLFLEYLALRRTRELYAEAARRENLESALRQSQKMEAVGQLTGGIAHDFNNLLTIIIGNLESLARQFPDTSKLHRKIKNALDGSRRAAELTHRLLAFSRRQPLDPKPVDANQLISRASDLLVRSLGERVKVETVRSAGLWLTEVDPAELEAAVINLAINARDAMPDGGKVTIETSNAFLDDAYCHQYEGVSPGQYVLISVSDEGAGMPKEVLDRAFEPFFTTKEPGLGTGLGLSQVYGFVKQSGGHTNIYSEVGVGTTVKIYLPRSFDSASEETSSASKEVVRGAGETILIVEDDTSVRNYLLELITELKYAAKTADGGEAAMAIINDLDQKIDLLLTDVVMPGMNGRQLADLALSRRPELKVLYMTGYSRNAIVHHGRLDPGVSMIQKPVSESDLALRIRSMLNGR